MRFAKNLHKLGTESAFKILAEAKKLEASGKKIIHLGLGQPDFKTPKHIVDAAKKALDDGHHGYVLSNGIHRRVIRESPPSQCTRFRESKNQHQTRRTHQLVKQ